jgi:G:T-mismatch repair DNA endonuclease (very short patch repair protein)
MNCEICNKLYDTFQSLASHISRNHKTVDLKEYTIKYFYNNKLPTCKCGCKSFVKYKYFGTFVKYISGHNSIDNNPFKNKHHTQETIQRILSSEGYKNKRSSKQDIFKFCLYCNSKIKTIKSQYNNKKFCNKECYSNFVIESVKNKTEYGTAYSKRASIGGANAILKGKRSLPEFNFERLLKENNIKFESQYKIILNEKVHVVDFYIPDVNLVIQIDGNYWHCNPKRFKKDYYHSRIKKYAKDIWLKDFNQVKDLQINGYNVKRIWESDIKNINNFNDYMRK